MLKKPDGGEGKTCGNARAPERHRFPSTRARRRTERAARGHQQPVRVSTLRARGRRAAARRRLIRRVSNARRAAVIPDIRRRRRRRRAAAAAAAAAREAVPSVRRRRVRRRRRHRSVFRGEEQLAPAAGSIPAASRRRPGRAPAVRLSRRRTRNAAGSAAAAETRPRPRARRRRRRERVERVHDVVVHAGVAQIRRGDETQHARGAAPDAPSRVETHEI